MAARHIVNFTIDGNHTSLGFSKIRNEDAYSVWVESQAFSPNFETETIGKIVKDGKGWLVEGTNTYTYTNRDGAAYAAYLIWTADKAVGAVAIAPANEALNVSAAEQDFDFELE